MIKRQPEQEMHDIPVVTPLMLEQEEACDALHSQLSLLAGILSYPGNSRELAERLVNDARKTSHYLHSLLSYI